MINNILKPVSIIAFMFLIMFVMVTIICTSCTTLNNNKFIYMGVVDYVVRTTTVKVIENQSDPEAFALNIIELTKNADNLVKNNNPLAVITLEEQFRHLINWAELKGEAVIIMEVLMSTIGREFLEDDLNKNQLTTMVFVMNSIHQAALNYIHHPVSL